MEEILVKVEIQEDQSRKKEEATSVAGETVQNVLDMFAKEVDRSRDAFELYHHATHML